MSSDRTVRLARLAFLVLAWAFVACLAVQLFLVGLDVFRPDGLKAADGTPGVHREFAYLYGWIAPGLVLLAVAGRLRRDRLLLTVALLVLFAVQTYLPTLADRAPLLAAFHAVNALAVVTVAFTLALGARDQVRLIPRMGGS